MSLAAEQPLSLRLPANRAVAVRGWAVAVSIYLLAVFHRSSLAVAGLRAEHRFGISAGQLSTFVLLQLGVYAAMQIPTGVLVDRFGPRRLLVSAAVLMGIAQLVFAVAPGYPTALLARGLLGCGDALTFVSVLRFAASHFSPRRYPVIIAVTGLIGGVGNIGATVPLSAALSSLGWSSTFGAVGVVSLLAGGLVWLVLPAGEVSAGGDLTAAQMRARLSRVTARVGVSWRLPGTRLGFWLHFACMSSATAFGVLWGYPFLVQGAGFSRGSASATLLVSVVTGLSVTPFVGLVTSRRPSVRVPMAIGVCLATLTGWTVVLAAPAGSLPRAVVVAFVFVMSAGPPASAIAFALARDYNGPALIGTATGVVNVGGFTAAIAASLGVGLVLDALGDSPDAYRAAMLSLAVVQLLGTVQMVRWWRRARAAVLAAQGRGERVPVTVVRHAWDLADGG